MGTIYASSTNRLIDMTQWVQPLAADVVVPDNGAVNLLESVTDASKILDPGNDGTLFISPDGGDEDFIQTNWQGVLESLTIRLILKIFQSGTDYYRIILRRKVDDSIISVHPFVMAFSDMPERLAAINIETYVGGAADPFVLNGFWVEFANASGANANLQENINLLIKRKYALSLPLV